MPQHRLLKRVQTMARKKKQHQKKNKPKESQPTDAAEGASSAQIDEELTQIEPVEEGDDGQDSESEEIDDLKGDEEFLETVEAGTPPFEESTMDAVSNPAEAPETVTSGTLREEKEESEQLHLEKQEEDQEREEEGALVGKEDIEEKEQGVIVSEQMEDSQVPDRLVLDTTETPPPSESPLPIEPLIEKPIKPIEPYLALKSISKGPYTISELLSLIDLNENKTPDFKPASITYIESHDSNLYLGTSQGEVFHYLKDPNSTAYSFKSRIPFHASRRSPIQKILILKSISKALILSGNVTSCFNLPNLEPSNIGRIKDVNDLSLDHDNIAKNDSSGVHCVVYGIKQIRIINVTNESLRLVRDINYPGILKGLRRGKFTVVFNSEMYDLIDLDNFGKIPLFPISTAPGVDDKQDVRGKLKPFIVSVSKNEFLLTCGTVLDEPAMGIVINNNGDVSRGTVSFAKYPESLEIDAHEGDLIISSIENEIKVQSIDEPVELQSVEFEKAVGSDLKLKVGSLKDSIDVADSELAELIKLVPLIDSSGNDRYYSERMETEEGFAKNIAKTRSNIYLLNGNKVNVLKPVSKLMKLNQVCDTKQLLKEFNSIQMINNTNEVNFVELEYLNLLIAISGLDSEQCDDLTWESLINGTIDPRIFCYIMGHEVFGTDVWIFNGISQKLNVLKDKRIKGSKVHQFLTKFLDDWIPKKSTDANMNDEKDSNILKTLELTKLRVLIKENDRTKISELISNSNLHNYEESASLLASDPLLVANMHLKKNEFRNAIELYKSIHDNSKLANQQTEIETLIVDLIYKYYNEFDDEYIYDLGIWLVNKNSQIGLNFLQNRKINPRGSTNDEYQLIISKIDKNSIKFTYIENLLIDLNAEKMRINLIKNLKKWELKKLDTRLKEYRSR